MAKSYNQPDAMKHFRDMALELSKIVKINLVHSVIFFQWIIIKLGVSNLVIMFVGIISPPHSITSQIS